MRVAKCVVELSEAEETRLQQLIVIDQLRSYPPANAEIPELDHVERVFVKARARVKNRAENSRRPTRADPTIICGHHPGRTPASSRLGAR
jgi:hypothetical protein